MRYYATFASGFQEVVRDILQETLPKSKIIELLDGSVVFESSDAPNVKFANNLFQVIDIMTEIENLDDFIKKLLTKKLEFSEKPKSAKTFRIVTSKHNRLVAVDNTLKQKLEKVIARQTGMKLNRLGADVEFWLLERSEGLILFLQRLTKHKDWEKILNKGELQPPIAYMLNFLSETKQGELYLDPFCGSGALPKNRNTDFPKAKVIASDIAKGVDFFTHDFGICFDKIVTDPPWGKFDTALDINQFYKNFFMKVAALLNKDGVLVLLTSRDIEINKFADGFKTAIKLDVLISGKKANIYKMKKL